MHKNNLKHFYAFLKYVNYLLYALEKPNILLSIIYNFSLISSIYPNFVIPLFSKSCKCPYKYRFYACQELLHIRGVLAAY